MPWPEQTTGAITPDEGRYRQASSRGVGGDSSSCVLRRLDSLFFAYRFHVESPVTITAGGSEVV